MKSLELDDLNVLNLNADMMDGNIIYYNKIEGNELIVDTRLTLTNTGVISVGNSIISDIELTYLDGTSSNIQQQINNIYLKLRNYKIHINLYRIFNELFIKNNYNDLIYILNWYKLSLVFFINYLLICFINYILFLIKQPIIIFILFCILIKIQIKFCNFI